MKPALEPMILGSGGRKADGYTLANNLIVLSGIKTGPVVTSGPVYAFFRQGSRKRA